MLPRTLFRHAQRKLSTSAWEVSLETTISDNEKDIFFHLIPIPKEQVPLLPTGTVAIRPVGRPSSYELLKMDSDKKIAALSAEFAELKTELSEVKGQLKAQDTRIIILEYKSLVLQIFESIKVAEKAIISGLLPSEASFVPEHFVTLEHFKIVAEKNGILAANVKNFFANPFVKEFQHLMKSKEFQVIRNYINVIAHSTFDDLSQINAIEEKLSKLVPHVPEKDARAIKAIIKKLPEIVRLLTFADKLTRKK